MHINRLEIMHTVSAQYIGHVGLRVHLCIDGMCASGSLCVSGE